MAAEPFTVEDAVPTGRLTAWVSDNVPGASGPLRIDHLSGGSSNLTFRVRDDANDWVLRRPPLGRLLATANDMGREYTVQRALVGTDVPVAAPVARCDDPDVIGAPFYLMQRLDGVVYDDADAVAHLTESQAAAATETLIDVLAALHAVEPSSVGLDGFGKPVGFLTRQVARWQKQWEASKQEEIPAIDEVLRRLAASIPPESGASIVHGDYSFNNTMWSRHDPTRMVGVLDWEMSTLGDPLTDLGMVVMYWGDMGELLWRQRAPQPHRLNPGFPTGDSLIDRYQATSGRAVDQIDVYCVLAAVKIAVITAGAQARIATTDPERAAGITPTIEAIAQLALDRASSSTVAGLRARGV